MQNTELKDFIEALKTSVAEAGKAEEIDIELWSSSWLTNAGVNSIQPNIQIGDEGVTVEVNQGYPAIGDKVYQQQVMQVKLFGVENESEIVEHTKKFTLLNQTVTEVHIKIPFKPDAALLNSGNLGYARVLLDDDSLKFFIANFDRLPTQLDRSQLYIIFFDCVKLL